MEASARSGSIWAAPAWRARLGLLLGIAFGPVLFDLARHLAENPWARGTLVFPWLVLRAARSTLAPARAARPAWAWLFLLAGLGFELIALGGDALRLARVGAAVAIAGILWSAGWVGAGTALLVLWCVPVPHQLLDLASPALESALGRLVAVAPGVGFEAPRGATTVLLSDPALRFGERVLPLQPLDGGLVLAVALAGIGWFLAARVAARPATAIACAARGAAAGLALQVVVLALGLGLVIGGAGEAAARVWLDHAGWLIVLGLGVAAGLWPERIGGARSRTLPDVGVDAGRDETGGSAG